ncbi:MAG: hypothetical protein K0Q49_1703 [Haloplasmataceae bacterium]|jgi:hypothetical protein|nr:hypothetical protein [Haloplasmataceae bacterium]
MKKRELYYEKIKINDTFSIQIDPNNNENLLILKNNEVIDTFSLQRKIYTLFKVLQDYLKDDDYVIVEDNQSKIYGQEINLYDNVYMKINPFRKCLTIDIYRKDDDNETLLYITKLTYISQKLFNMILIPKKLIEQPNFYITNVFKFIDMLELMNSEKIN